MKKRVMLLFVSLFAVTPVLLGSTSWAGHKSSVRTYSGDELECNLKVAKHVPEKTKKENAQDRRGKKAVLIR